MRTATLRLLLVLIAGFGQVTYLTSGAFGQSTPSVPANTSITAQSSPPANSAAVHVTQEMLDRAMFQIYFSHVATVDRIASKLESEGKNENDFRARDQKKAGLTESEGAIVHEVALDYIKALKDQSAKSKAADAAIYNTRPANIVAVASASKASEAPGSISDVVREHISQLQQQLDADSYAKLYKYVKKLLNFHDLGVSVRIGNVTPSSKPVTPSNSDHTGDVQ